MRAFENNILFLSDRIFFTHTSTEYKQDTVYRSVDLNHSSIVRQTLADHSVRPCFRRVLTIAKRRKGGRLKHFFDFWSSLLEEPSNRIFSLPN